VLFPYGDTLHIPDGYLGPETYIALFIIMIPIWLYASYRLNRELRSKQVPYLALAAAFTFVIMMINVPAPGGGTGHAVGAAIIGIVLGPWAAVVSITVALVIQALMFGDGGVTCIGANCFNMAFVMPFSAYMLYRLISGRSPVTSKRRLAAAAVAGYVALIAAAGATAIEFGLQPVLHPATTGQFMYMPYGLGVTIPVMIGEHLILGLLEAAVTVLVFAYLQRTDPKMLETKNAKLPAVKPASAVEA
jgi:cobalt/nickel transport system permease protein